MALGLFCFIAAAGRTMVVANTFGTFTLIVVFVLGGFGVSKNDIKPWWIWGFWSSPLMYGQNAIAINEFLDPRWGAPNNDTNIDAPTVGTAILKSRGVFSRGYWYWRAIGALIGFIILFNILFILALTYLDPLASAQNAIVDEELSKNKKSSRQTGRVEMIGSSTNSSSQDVSDAARRNSSESFSASGRSAKRGMVLPFPASFSCFQPCELFC